MWLLASVGARRTWVFPGMRTLAKSKTISSRSRLPSLGDYNADDIVDDADYELWKSTFGSTVDLRADGNKNGIVDGGDYTIWRNNMGAVRAGRRSGAVVLAAVESAPVTAASLQAERVLPAVDRQQVIDACLRNSPRGK